MHTKHLVFAFILCSSFAYSQNTEWIVDTIYTDVIHLKNTYIFSNEEKSIVLNNDGINPFVRIDDYRWFVLSDQHIIEIDNKCYLLEEDLSINFEQGIDLSLSHQSYDGQHMKVVNQTIAYISNDSVFIDNFAKPNKTFITTDMLPFLCNDNYLWLQKQYPEEDYIYDINQQKLKKLPESYQLPKTENKHFILNWTLTADLEETVEMLNLDLQKIIDKKEGYDGYIMNEDILSVFGPNKATKYWFKGKKIRLPQDIVEIDLLPKSGINILKNKKGKFGIMNAKGDMIHPMDFDACTSNFLSVPIIIAKKEDHIYVLNDKAEVIFSGKYDNAKYLSQDRFQVESNYSLGVVNSKNEIIIPFKRNRNGRFLLRNEYDKEIIIWKFRDEQLFYTYDGEFITESIQTNNEPKSASDGYLFSFCSWKMINSLTPSQIQKINPSNLWKRRKKINDKMHFSIENNSKKKITDWYLDLKRIKKTNTFLVKTITSKKGIIKIGN